VAELLPAPSAAVPRTTEIRAASRVRANARSTRSRYARHDFAIEALNVEKRYGALQASPG